MEKYASLLDEAKQIQSLLYGGLDLVEKTRLYHSYIKLNEQAAEMGSNEAQYQLGQHFEDINYWGTNPDFDPKKCIYWYTKACDNDHPEACNSLAHYYELGEGIKKNLALALSLYKKSAILGSELGNENHKLLSKELSRPPLLRFLYKLVRKVKLLWRN